MRTFGKIFMGAVLGALIFILPTQPGQAGKNKSNDNPSAKHQIKNDKHKDKGNKGGKGNKKDKYDHDYDYDKGDKNHHGSYHDDYGAGTIVNAGISLVTVRDIAIRERYTGYSALPPGIKKNLARGKPLPPGIAKKMVPGNMLRGLPVHPGYEWTILGTDLALVSTDDGIVADILAGVFD